MNSIQFCQIVYSLYLNLPVEDCAVRFVDIKTRFSEQFFAVGDAVIEYNPQISHFLFYKPGFKF